MNKEWAKVTMFRCVQDPMIGPKPKQAFMLSDNPGWEAYYHIPSCSVHVKTTFNARIHIVGTGNLNKVELEGDYGPFQAGFGENDKENEIQKKSPGRPKLAPA